MATHELWRQDDNGNQVRVATHATREQAEAAREAFEARAHKQIYWVVSKDAPATLHFVYGLPAAGKTGVARALAERIGGLFICEDEWLLALGGTITTVEAYVDAARRVRTVIAPMATRVLSLGVSVVLDFAGNTVRDRAWVRSIFEAAHAAHMLHVLDVPIEECRRRLHERNANRPPGLYFGHVGDELFDRIVPHIVPPTPDEALHVVPA